MKLLNSAVLTASLLALSTEDLTAQVVINEVNFKSGDQWIELYNASSTVVKLGTFSIYHATKTPFRFGDYWWPFPTSAEIASKGYLKINWGKATGSAPKDNLHTGDSAWNFLFGHGFEALDPAQGALAICSTQDNKEVNNANIFSDWWQWGEKGFKRESVATGNKPTSLWNVNSTLPKVASGASLIVIANKLGFPHALSSFDQDSSPTPLTHNTLGMNVRQDKSSCSWNMKDVELTGRGHAFAGSSSFKVVIKNTRGPAFFESMFYLIRIDGDVQTYTRCKDVLSTKIGTTWWMTGFFGTTFNETVHAIPNVSSMVGWTFYTQAVVTSAQSFSFSNHLLITTGK